VTTTAETESIAEVPKGSETVLLVEDEEDVLRLVRGLLSSAGYNVLAVNTPQGAIELAEAYQGAIDLLVTDLVMPGKNGRELAAALGRSRPGLKCLYMSGYPADVTAHHGLVEPGLYLIQKPFSMRLLARTVRQVIDQPTHPA
jgi:DNA-binding NtrC family response regulator